MSIGSFRAAYAALHEPHRPYEWQIRAAAELARTGWWPALRAPTGAGKTALIDCWLHALAVSGPDRLGRRLVWVVDRRSVVDQIHAYAAKVIETLTSDTAPEPLRELHTALCAIGGGQCPRAVLWRGGLDDEASIAMRAPLDPASVAVIVSTVDQLGSRLLFRGYGMGVRARSLHAGLLGSDTTVVLDEAHLADPLRETVARVAELQSMGSRAVRPAIRTCAVSATLEAPDAFELTPSEFQEEGIARRICASKLARLTAERSSIQVVGHVRELARDGAEVIGVVMNTVAEARAAFDALEVVAPTPLEDRVLLIGPVRPLDRADLLAAIPARDERSPRATPLVVVATQTIEVGVDLDFDALITACAPIVALVQRFGRLDRAGALVKSRAVVLAPPRRGCPVYGPASGETWEWLEGVADAGVVDMGVAALTKTLQHHPAPRGPAGVPKIRLLDLHVDTLAVTDAFDDETPSIELLLHGDRETSPEVSVAWRDIKPGEELVKDLGRDGALDRAADQDLEVRPLHPGEVVSLSLAAFRRWMATGEVSGLADVESVAQDGAPPAHPVPQRQVDIWSVSADDAKVSRLRRAAKIQPGDRIVVATSSGGLDDFGWAPARSAGPEDYGSLATRGPRLVLPLDPGGEGTIVTVAEELMAGRLTPSAAARQLKATIADGLPAPHPHRSNLARRIGAAVDALSAGRATLLDGGILIVGRGARAGDFRAAGGIVELDDHQRRVAERAARTASALDVPAEVATSIQRAAEHHDEGKRDPRFQAWLRGGVVTEETLAKGAYRYDPIKDRKLREASGWPARKRHELVSAVAVARAFPDDALAAWLTATHHGLNRPFVAAVADPESGDVPVRSAGAWISVAAAAVPASGVQLDALAELSDEYGPWGLALIEAILISADRIESAKEGRQ